MNIINWVAFKDAEQELTCLFLMSQILHVWSYDPASDNKT